MKNNKFSIIIPVKNRVEYIGNVLDTCCMQDYQDINFIVSDDNSDDGTEELVRDYSKKDSRIIYTKNKYESGMRANFEFAIDQVDEGYIIALGGDDGLLPKSIIYLNSIINSTGHKLITWEPPFYSYNGVNQQKAQLNIARIKKNYAIKSKDFIKRQYKNLNYLQDPECPMFYIKGCVSVDLIKQVKNLSEDKRFYRCPTPDGYSGIILAKMVDEYLFLAKPISIYGLSPKSQGFSYMKSDIKSVSESRKFFADSEKNPMHPKLASQPYSPLITLMTADYLLMAADLKPASYDMNIDIKKLIEKSLEELSIGLYEKNVIGRELDILNKIAIQHGLEEHFLKSRNAIYRRAKKNPYRGNGFNGRSYFLDADALELNNILDASIFAKSFIDLIGIIGFKAILISVLSSISYKLKALKKLDKLIQVKNK